MYYCYYFLEQVHIRTDNKDWRTHVDQMHLSQGFETASLRDKSTKISFFYVENVDGSLRRV